MSRARIIVLFGGVPLYGSERINIETLDQLQQRGAAVLFLIRSDWTSQTIQPELMRRRLAFRYVPFFDAVRHEVGLLTWLRNIKGIIGGSWALLTEIRRFRPTHLHVNNTAWVLNFLPALVLSRVPLVFRAGDLPSQHHFLWRWVWSYTQRRALTFVCDSEYVRTRLIALGAPRSCCSVIYAPPPSRASVPMGAALSSTTSVDAPDVTFLYVGQISADKGVDLLVESAIILLQRYNCRFLIAGDYTWRNPLGEALVSRVAVLGLTDRIQFLGYVSDIDGLYAESQVHLSPSVWEEPYGLTVIEAKSRGIPSIVFASGGLTELVRHGEEGWVCTEKSATTLVAAMEHYLQFPNEIAIHGAAARASLAQRLRIEEYGQSWEAVYATRS